MANDSVVGASLDPDLHAAFRAYMKSNGMTKSQAVRTLLAVALRPELGDQAFRAAAFREGVQLGLHALKKRLNETITQALGDMEQG